MIRMQPKTRLYALIAVFAVSSAGSVFDLLFYPVSIITAFLIPHVTTELNIRSDTLVTYSISAVCVATGIYTGMNSDSFSSTGLSGVESVIVFLTCVGMILIMGMFIGTVNELLHTLLVRCGLFADETDEESEEDFDE